MFEKEGIRIAEISKKDEGEGGSVVEEAGWKQWNNMHCRNR